MSDVRLEVWMVKNSKRHITKTPELKSLPPTTEAFTEHVKRAQFQIAIWNSALNQNPPNLDPVNFGWAKESSTKSLTPVAIPLNHPLAPAQIMQMIRCGCASDQPCAGARCGCYAAQLACTVFCNCQTTNNCLNHWTKYAVESNDDDIQVQSDNY